MKTPRFFCERCGTEVSRDARVCPTCGRFFSAVKCPRCGHSGKESEFDAGCPACGYVDPSPGPSRRSPDRKPVGALPAGVAFAAAGALLFAIALLLAYLRVS